MRIQFGKLALLLSASVGIAAAQQSSTLQVKTETGIVEGKAQGSSRAFLGIPYAAPPVGELRWKAPAPPVAWQGVRDAAKFGAECMQGRIFDDMVFRDTGPSEDCLMLNVWTPAKAAKSKLPVMVWIHGGGFVAGASSEPRQDGATLAAEGVVVVSMNYRMGIFGFFELPELIADSGRNAAGNYGLLDQVASLQWVKKNIAAFGGDPGNVTIFGESAGSFSVSELMASPLARGLFQRAIGESGADFPTQAEPRVTLEQTAKDGAEYAKKVLGTDSLKELRAIPADKLLETVSKPGSERRGPSMVVVDGYFLPKPVREIFAAGAQNDVPLLAGWNRDEGSGAVLSAKPPLTAASVKELGEKEFKDKAAEFFKLYPVTDDATAIRSWEDFAGDRFIAFGTWKWMEAQSAKGKSPVYRYRFDQAPPDDSSRQAGMGAFHSGEIEYVFGTLEWRIPTLWRSEDKALSELMRKYWTNFARSGDPNGAGLPPWPAYKPGGDAQVMHLSGQSKAAKDDQRERYQFLKKAWDN
jgi:para-nitrobenzyl esterase